MKNIMKHTVYSACIASLLVTSAAVAANKAAAPHASQAMPAVVANESAGQSYTGEPWKGRPDSSQFSVGALTGLGTVGTSGGYALLGTASKKIIQNGFVPDINNSVSVELEFGPLFTHGTNWAYSAHLRWDFQRDDEWTLYALAGAGGDITSGDRGNEFLLFPRVGLGAMWRFSPLFAIRGEFSHELLALGVNFPL
jgi:opacity protein-like surface antigen